MVLKNLPFEFDSRGLAKLRQTGAGDPFGIEQIMQKNGAVDAGQGEETIDSNAPGAAAAVDVWGIRIDPLTRVSGDFSINAEIDFKNRKIVGSTVYDAGLQCIEPLFYGRKPADAIHFAARMNGAGSGAQAIASAMALEMAFDITPPPLAVITRGLGAAAEMLAVNTRHLFLLAGPDYSEAVVSRTNIGLWTKAQQAQAKQTQYHGFTRIADLMRGLNPVTGHLYREALHLMRVAMEVATLILGKYPHPSTVFPGGMGIEADKDVFNQVLGRINRLIDYSKKVAAVWDDLVEFFFNADPDYMLIGELPGNLISAGLWDDPAVYDAKFLNCNLWGEKRLATPGVIIDGTLRTTRLTELNAGIEEFTDKAILEQWREARVKTDPSGGALSPLHPWNKKLNHRTGEDASFKQTHPNASPRWDRELLETGPMARLWITALGGKLKNEFIHTFRNVNGAGLEINLPKFQLPATKLKWHAPVRPNALERNLARAYHIAYSGMIALTYLLKAFDCLQRRETAMSVPYRVPQQSIGAGFWEDGQGILTHHTMIVDGRLFNYQIVAPSDWMGSAHNPSGRPGPYEQAIINTPLLEQFKSPEEFTGIDILRAIRSFDP